MGLLERVNAVARGETRYSADTWLDQYLLPANQFTYNGTVYPFGLNTTWTQSRTKEVTNSLPGYLGALRSCPPAFAAQLVRALVLSQARFVFRNRPTSATPRRTFGTRDLGILERPWRNATTGQMLARMEWHAGLAGNAYVVRQADRLRVLRPDWVAILYGSDLEPDNPMHALDGEVIGYVYQNGGVGSAGRITTLLPEDVAHWSPMPDPERAEIGMSWITPAIREIQADRAATEHTLQFFAHGATPNMVVKGIPAATREQFDGIVDAMESRHAGVANAYRTLYLTAGADATVVGANLSEINLTGVQGASETRITYLSRVPATLLGIAAGLSGSSLNAGNFGQARRTFSDSWVYPSLQDLSAALAPLVKVPSDAELWFDVSDIPLLREDASDAANIMQVKATTITTYVKEGFTPESAIAAVRAQDETLLKHSGMVSVQLQPPGSTPAAPPLARGRQERKFDPHEPRRPDGKWGSGGVAHKLAEAVEGAGDGDLAVQHRSLDAPPVKLADLTRAHDPRAGSLWFRTGDNSMELRGDPGFIRMNRYMRDPGRPDPAMDKRIADIDSVMRQSKLSQPITVYRGMDLYGVFGDGDPVGREFTDAAFSSTTADPSHADTWGTVLRIHVPSGVAAVRMDDRDPDLRESEVLLDKGLRYRITGRSGNVLDAEVVR